MHYPKSAMTDGERRVWFDTWCEDLGRLSDQEIAYACQRYRQDAANRFFPSAGQLMTLSTSAYADKPARSRGRMLNGTDQPWGGNCQCDRCMKKTPSEGFFHASRAEHTRDGDICGELDYDMERRVGYDPKTGNPNLDNTIERPRSPQELAALLSQTRKSYPRAFGELVREISDAPRQFGESDPAVIAEMRSRLESKIDRREEER